MYFNSHTPIRSAAISSQKASSVLPSFAHFPRAPAAWQICFAWVIVGRFIWCLLLPATVS